MDKTTKRRLLKLIEFMEKLPPKAAKHFDMKKWFLHAGADHSHGLKNKRPIPKDALTACGTTACALGWASTMPYFQKLGLKMTADKSYDGLWYAAMSFKGRAIFDDATGGLFPKLGEDRSMELFGARNNDVSPKAWAKRVRGLIAEWESETV